VQRKSPRWHNLHTIVPHRGALTEPAGYARPGRADRSAGLRAGQPTFEPVIRPLGTGWPFFIALNMRSALV
jgi:hypothetical protein